MSVFYVLDVFMPIGYTCLVGLMVWMLIAPDSKGADHSFRLFPLKPLYQNGIHAKIDAFFRTKGLTVRDGYYMFVPVQGVHESAKIANDFRVKHINSDRISFVLKMTVDGADEKGFIRLCQRREGRYTEELIFPNELEERLSALDLAISKP